MIQGHCIPPGNTFICSIQTWDSRTQAHPVTPGRQKTQRCGVEQGKFPRHWGGGAREPRTVREGRARAGSGFGTPAPLSSRC